MHVLIIRSSYIEKIIKQQICIFDFFKQYYKNNEGLFKKKKRKINSQNQRHQSTKNICHNPVLVKVLSDENNLLGCSIIQVIVTSRYVFTLGRYVSVVDDIFSDCISLVPS